MNREKAIEAAERALFMHNTGRAWDEEVAVQGRPIGDLARLSAHRDAVVAIDAALPHLVGEADRGTLRSLLGELMADRRRLIDYASIACSDDPPRALVLHARAEGIRLAMERIDGLLYLIPVDGP